jgi:hypothetical protein
MAPVHPWPRRSDRATALIAGETGTGRECRPGCRRPRPRQGLVSPWAVRRPRELLERAVRHVPRAFTDAAPTPGAVPEANGGTLFLDDRDLSSRRSCRYLRGRTVRPGRQRWRSRSTSDRRRVIATSTGSRRAPSAYYRLDVASTCRRSARGRRRLLLAQLLRRRPGRHAQSGSRATRGGRAKPRVAPVAGQRAGLRNAIPAVALTSYEQLTVEGPAKVRATNRPTCSSPRTTSWSRFGSRAALHPAHDAGGRQPDDRGADSGSIARPHASAMEAGGGGERCGPGRDAGLDAPQRAGSERVPRAGITAGRSRAAGRHASRLPVMQSRRARCAAHR